MSKSPFKKKQKKSSSGSYKKEDLENALVYIHQGLNPLRVARTQGKAETPSQNKLVKEAQEKFGVPFGTLSDNYRKKYGEQKTHPKNQGGPKS